MLFLSYSSSSSSSCGIFCLFPFPVHYSLHYDASRVPAHRISENHRGIMEIPRESQRIHRQQYQQQHPTTTATTVGATVGTVTTTNMIPRRQRIS